MVGFQLFVDFQDTFVYITTYDRIVTKDSISILDEMMTIQTKIHDDNHRLVDKKEAETLPLWCSRWDAGGGLRDAGKKEIKMLSGTEIRKPRHVNNPRLSSRI